MNFTLKLSRRRFLPLCAAAGSLSAYSKPLFAADYPSQTISFLIPDSIGGGSWTYVREFATLLSNYFDPRVNVEPISDPGANGQKAAFDLFHATPDGYTIGMLGDVMSVTSAAGMLRQLTWIATVGRSLFALAVNPKSHIRSVVDLQKLSRTRPVVFASSGRTALSYLAIKLFCSLNSIKAKIVTGYEGSTDAMLAVVRGDVDATAQSLPTLQKIEKSGLIRTMFVYGDESPIPGVDDSTTVGHPELSEVIQWRFVAGPPGLQARIADQLSKAFLTLTAQPETIAWAEKVDVPLYPLGPAQTAQAVNKQLALVAKWQHLA